MTNISFLNLKVVKEKTARYDIERKIKEPEDCYKVAIQVMELGEQAEETLWLMCLDTKNQISGIFEVARGSLNSSIVHPREVFKRAIMQNSSAIVIFHNHPSGDTKPSQEDINVTKRLCEAGKLLGIDLLDHIIVGDDNYTSLRKKGIL